MLVPADIEGASSTDGMVFKEVVGEVDLRCVGEVMSVGCDEDVMMMLVDGRLVVDGFYDQEMKGKELEEREER